MDFATKSFRKDETFTTDCKSVQLVRESENDLLQNPYFSSIKKENFLTLSEEKCTLPIKSF